MRDVIEFMAFGVLCYALWRVIRGPTPPGGTWE